MSEEYIQVFTARGMLDAETYRLFLQSFGIEAVLFQESAGAVYGLTVGPMGVVQIMVPASLADRATELLQQMEQGAMEIPDEGASASNNTENQP